MERGQGHNTNEVEAEASCSEAWFFGLEAETLTCLVDCRYSRNGSRALRRSQKFDLGGYKLHDIEFVLGKGDKTTT